MNDFEPIEQAAQILRGTNRFGTVTANAHRGVSDPAPPDLPACWIYPVAWQTSESTGGGSEEQRLRRVTFETLVTTDANDTAEATDPAALAQVVEDALHGSTLGGTVLGPLTRCESGSYRRIGTSKTRQHELILIGEYSYMR